MLLFFICVLGTIFSFLNEITRQNRLGIRAFFMIVVEENVKTTLAKSGRVMII